MDLEMQGLLRRIERLEALVRQMQTNVRAGEGTPEGNVDAPRGTVWERRDGSAGTVLYVKTTALGVKTGWSAFA